MAKSTPEKRIKKKARKRFESLTSHRNKIDVKRRRFWGIQKILGTHFEND